MILEPHGAVAWEGMEYYENLSDNNKNQLFVSLETAHPAKFNEEIKSILGFSLPFPESLRDIDSKKEEFLEMENNYEELRSYIRTLNK